MNIDLGDINYLAVIVGVIISMVAGGAWYGAFAGPWTAEVGITREEVQAQPWSERWKPYGVAVVGAILLTLALALAVFIQAAGVTGVVDGLVVGLIAGIGFVAVALASNHAFEGKSLKLYLINAGFPVVQYAVLGILLAAWQ